MQRVFQYEAKDRMGKIARGILEAENEKAVAVALRKEGYFVTNLAEKTAGKSSFSGILKKGVKTRDLSIFAKQFSTMINAGLPLVKSLDILAKQTENPTLAEVVAGVKQEVEQGKSLSEGMLKYKYIFPELMINMVQAGEVGGVLDQVLERVSIYLEKDHELKSKIKSAMKYPAFIIVVAVIAISVIMATVVPQFSDLFGDLGAELPLPTQILMKVSNFMASYWWAILIVVGAVGFAVYRYVQTETGRFNKDKFLLKIPVIGDLIRKSVVAKFTQTFGTLLRTGVPMVAALEMVARSSGNKVVENVMFDVLRKIKEGSTLAIPLEKTGFFPPMVIHMVSIGEETGALDTMLGKVADFYEKEVAVAVDGLMALVEPALTVLMGGAVGTIVVSILMPMLTLGQQIQ